MNDELITQSQHRLVEALAAAEKSAGRRLDLLREIVFETDSAGRLTFLNQAWERLLGIAAAGCVGRPFADYILPEDRPAWLAIQSKSALIGGDPGSFELRLVAADGLARTFDALLTSADGEGIVGSLHDVTERNQRRRDLDEARLRYRAILDHSSHFIGLLDTAGRLLDANLTALNFANVRAADVLGLPFWETPWWRHSAGEQARLQDGIQRASRGEAVRFETVHADSDGTPRYVDFALTPIADETGKIVYLLPEGRDITDRKRAHELFRRVVEASPNALLLVDRQGVVQLANDQAEQWFGYTQEELVGSSVDLLVPESLRACHAQARARYSEAPVVRPMGSGRELVARRKDGSEFPVEIGLRPVVTDSGPMILSSIVDISERKQIAADLRCAKEAAEKASSAKSEFLAHMSHEIRTPLNGVLTATELLLTSVTTPAQKEYLEIIEASSHSLMAVVNDILDFSKIEAGMLDLETVEFDVRTAIDTSLPFFGLKAQEKHLDLICDVASDVPWTLQGDPLRLRQVLTNLIGNAVKFTEAGEITLRVAVVARAAGEVTLRFAVRDTGIGIPDDRLDLLFRPFVQVDSSTSRKYGGTGLGLAISASLVSLMRGETGVSSQVGKESTFWFTARFGVAAGPARHGFQQPLKSRHCLLLAPSSMHREIVVGWLAAWGCRCARAATLSEGRDYLRQADRTECPVDTVLIDGQREDWAQVAAWVHEAGAPPTAHRRHWIVLTTRADQHWVGRLQGVDRVLAVSKPVTQASLRNALDTLAEAAGPAGAAAGRTATRPAAAEQWHHSGRILLAEDNPVNRKVVVTILNRLGYTVDAVENGLLCIEALRSRVYDLVLMDCQMPELDGYETTRFLRDPDSHVLDHKVPVIALTAHAMPGERERCFAAGMDDYLTKPINTELLRAALREWLQDREEPDPCEPV